MPLLILTASLLGSFSAQAFLLIDPDYRLANPKDTVVNIASNTCGNNIPTDILLKAIEIAVNDFWNTVTESTLRLKVGSVVAKTTLAEVSPGEILIGCNGDTVGNGGSTNNSNTSGASIITLDAGILTSIGFGRLVWVVAHEMGHSIGLTHSGDPASIMTYDAHGWGPQPEHLAQDDKNGVIYLYPIDGQAGGLIPGCSVNAAQKQQSGKNLALALMQELAGILLLVGFYKLWMRLQKKFSKT